MSLCNMREISAFREEFSKNLVSVLDSPLLSGAIRVGEIDSASESLCDGLVVSEFDAIIGCYSQHIVLEWCEHSYDCLLDVFRFFRR